MINLLFKYVKILFALINNKIFSNKVLNGSKQSGCFAVAGKGNTEVLLEKKPQKIEVFFVKSFESKIKYESKSSVLKFEALEQEGEYLIHIEWEVPSSSIIYWEAQF